MRKIITRDAWANSSPRGDHQGSPQIADPSIVIGITIWAGTHHRARAHHTPGARLLFAAIFSSGGSVNLRQISAAPPTCCAALSFLRSDRSEVHTTELQPLMSISYAVFRLKTNKKYTT